MTAGTVTPPRASVGPSLRTWFGRLPRSPIFYGIVVAVIAGVAGQWLSISPPAAYGICSACHGRDLVDWTLNHIEGTKLYVTAAGANWPLLTVVGLVLGSFAASKRNGEFASIDLGGNVAPVRPRLHRHGRLPVRRRLPDPDHHPHRLRRRRCGTDPRRDRRRAS